MTASKPIAHFGKILGWGDMGERGVNVALGDVVHPELGMQPTVYTSKVHQIHWDEEGVIYEVETKNTIYLRKEDDDIA